MGEKKITVIELQDKLNNKDRVLILDVRPEDQRQEWKIAGSTHVDAYTQLNAGDDSAFDFVDIPENAMVVTVCAAGRTSLLAANLLERNGFNAYSLEGGMKAWNYAWNLAETTFGNGAKVIQVRRPAKGVLSYMVGSSTEAIVIDASLDPHIYQKLAEQNGWTIKYVMDTHIHADFVSRTGALASMTGAEHLLIDKAEVDFKFTPIVTGQIIKFGNSQLQFLHTPGHTWESTTLKLDDNAIFTGDTLFIDGIGRPDLKAKQGEIIDKANSLYNSLRVLFSLDPLLLVFPAHTSNAIDFDNRIIADSIKTIRDTIQQLKMSQSEFVNYTISNIPPTPPNYLSIAGINKNGLYDSQLLPDLEAGGNHCAIK